MKIELDKALLWLVPYLYLVSTAYYWGYWGTLDIDASSYYEAADLVKGLTTHLAPTVALMIIMMIVGLLNGAFNLISDPLKRPLWVNVLTAIVLIIFFYAIVGSTLNEQIFKKSIPVDGYNSSTIDILWLFLSAITGAIITYPSWDNLNAHYTTFNKYEIVYFSFVMSLLFLPGHAYITGKETALRITENKAFNYILTDSISHKKQEMYKYLGKAGDYQFLLTMDNNKSIIIISSEITPLSIEHFSLLDTASVHRFKTNKNIL